MEEGGTWTSLSCVICGLKVGWCRDPTVHRTRWQWGLDHYLDLRGRSRLERQKFSEMLRVEVGRWGRDGQAARKNLYGCLSQVNLESVYKGVWLSLEPRHNWKGEKGWRENGSIRSPQGEQCLWWKWYFVNRLGVRPPMAFSSHNRCLLRWLLSLVSLTSQLLRWVVLFLFLFFVLLNEVSK